MGLYKELPEAINEVDVIIAGAGCVVAARLADADPDLSILLIEGGPNNEMPSIEHPAFFLAHLAPYSKTNRFYMTKKSPKVADRTLVLATGSVLGGGSSTNMMMYSRAQRSDWDSWNTPGWSADEMLPYLKKLETYHGKDEKGVHGHDGPIHVSRGSYSSPRIGNETIAPAAKMGWPEVDDLFDLDSINAIWRAQRFISPEGKRQDAASCYIHPRLHDGKHPNLQVLVETQVNRILIDENHRAVGVEFRPTPAFRPDAVDQLLRSVKASRLVVASCGACGTPSLLERSGVGDPKVLERADVPVVIDLPGVGNGYEDHHLLGYLYLNSLHPSDTLDGLALGRMGSYEDLIKKKEKMLGWNGQEIQAKIRPTEAEVAALGPDFQDAWDKEFKGHPDKPLGIINILGGFPGDPSQASGDPCLAVTAFTPYPYSRGHIHITGPSLDDPVDFETGFFTDVNQLDVKKHVWLYKKQRELIRRMPSYRGEMAQFHPPFAAESSAAIVKLEGGPLPADVADISYTAQDDIVLKKWIRENKGVVDTSLGVYGISGLKIADLSIAPRNVAANTNNTALAVGEKAADIFIKELSLGST